MNEHVGNKAKKLYTSDCNNWSQCESRASDEYLSLGKGLRKPKPRHKNDSTLPKHGRTAFGPKPSSVLHAEGVPHYNRSRTSSAKHINGSYLEVARNRRDIYRDFPAHCGHSLFEQEALEFAQHAPKSRKANCRDCHEDMSTSFRFCWRKSYGLFYFQMIEYADRGPKACQRPIRSIKR